jgi:hypothetical protein
MPNLLNHLGRSAAAAFTAFALAAIAHGAVCFTALPTLSTAAAAAVQI